MLVAGPGTPADSVASLIALAKKSPGSLYLRLGRHRHGEPPAGACWPPKPASTLTHVPFKGTAGAQVDLLWPGASRDDVDNLTNGLANARPAR